MHYQKCKIAVQARRHLFDVYGEYASRERQCQNWFTKFHFGNFDDEDAPCSGRAIEADEGTIQALTVANCQIATHEFAEKLNLLNSTVHNYVKHLGLISKLSI